MKIALLLMVLIPIITVSIISSQTNTVQREITNPFHRVNEHQTRSIPKVSQNQNEERLDVDGITFSTREEALEFALEHFTFQELLSFYEKAQDGVNEEEKQAIHSQLAERLTKEEIDALITFEKKEMNKLQK
ncbi:hypothetical protein [Halalkalibacter urbisdiaboli]|uniref:hypothetical protein n=1 Tax=Halalkalibacter urbisdiaboli TaxID=1960589 RepID=UPI000B445650|nr:hypothetical protein [Halalkalibacter urbisdiaboli]